MSNVTVNTVPPPVLESFHKALLAVHKPKYIYSFGAMREEMPANAGEFIKFRRYNRLPPAPIPLSDNGDPIPSTNAVITDISAKIQLFGQWMGRIYAHLKSLLIDLELCIAENKGQAQAA